MKKLAGILLAIIFILTSGAFTGSAKADGAYEAYARYTVLLLDTSGPETFVVSEPNFMNLYGEEYTSNSSIEDVKQAAETFLEDIQSSLDKNYVAIVGFDTDATIYSDFTDDISSLKEALNSVECRDCNDRSITSGLKCTYGLLQSVPSEKTIKNVVLCTTGLTDEGDYSYTGYYDEGTTGSEWQNMGTQIRLYAYANAALTIADIIKASDTAIYVVGIFNPIESALTTNSTSDVRGLLRQTARDLASSAGTFYDVYDVSELEFVFESLQGDVAGSEVVRLYSKNSNYKNEKHDSKMSEEDSKKYGGSSYYVDVLWGSSLFEVPSRELYKMSLSTIIK